MKGLVGGESHRASAARFSFISLKRRDAPVCIHANVVDQGAALQHGLHLPQGDVLPRLQLHQVFLTVWKHSKACSLGI